MRIKIICEVFQNALLLIRKQSILSDENIECLWYEKTSQDYVKELDFTVI
jgi:hypothetical protein